MTTLFEMVGASFSLITALMAFLWLIYFFQRNATIVDLGWVASFIIAAWAYFFIGNGYFPKRLIITLMVTVWAGRLLWHLWMRYDSRVEDPRYGQLREALGADSREFKFFLMFIFQGLIALILTLPFFLVSWGASNQWSQWEFWGFLVWFIGVGGEILADRQLERFKKRAGNEGKVCQEGLWFWSRHPNYFFEFIVWVGFAIFAWSAPFGFLAISAPIIMYYLLVHVTGVPPAEAQSLKSKGDEYAKYQQSTSLFFPWFRK